MTEEDRDEKTAQLVNLAAAFQLALDFLEMGHEHIKECSEILDVPPFEAKTTVNEFRGLLKATKWKLSSAGLSEKDIQWRLDFATMTTCIFDVFVLFGKVRKVLESDPEVAKKLSSGNPSGQFVQMIKKCACEMERIKKLIGEGDNDDFRFDLRRN